MDKGTFITRRLRPRSWERIYITRDDCSKSFAASGDTSRREGFCYVTGETLRVLLFTWRTKGKYFMNNTETVLKV